MKIINLFLAKGNYFVLLFLVMLAINGCEKDVLLEHNNSMGNATENLIYDRMATSEDSTDCGLSNLCTTVLCHISDDEDTENHNINMILYNYAWAVKEAAQDPLLLCTMVDALLQDNTGAGIPIDDLISKNSLQNGLLASVSANSAEHLKATNLSEAWQSPATDLHGVLRNKLSYGEDVYEPIIYFVNPPENCNDNAPVTVLIAQDVNDCDQVVGWRDNQMILVSEADALASTEIMIFVGVGMVSDDVKLNDPDGEAAQAEGRAVEVIVDIDVDVRQIKKGHRYEKGRKSEIRGWAIVSKLDESGKLKEHNFDLGKIKKKDIKKSKIFYDDKNAWESSQSAYFSNITFYGTYERDWWASKKTISNTCVPSKKADAQMRMKYSHEYYFKDCGISPIGNLTPGSPTVFKTLENKKCMFKMRASLKNQ